VRYPRPTAATTTHPPIHTTTPPAGKEGRDEGGGGGMSLTFSNEDARNEEVAREVARMQGLGQDEGHFLSQVLGFRV